MTQKLKRREIRLLLWIKVRVCFPLLPSPIKYSSTGFQNVISRISKVMAPADSAKSSNYSKSQLDYSIFDGRYKANSPRTSVAPPVELFNHAFGHFLDDVKGDLAPPDDTICQTVEYMKAASAIYKSEQEHRKALSPLLCAILDVNVQSIVNDDKTNPDGIVEMAQGTSLFMIYLEEDKNKVGDGGSEVSEKCAGKCAGERRCVCGCRFRVNLLKCMLSKPPLDTSSCFTACRCVTDKDGFKNFWTASIPGSGLNAWHLCSVQSNGSMMSDFFK